MANGKQVDVTLQTQLKGNGLTEGKKQLDAVDQAAKGGAKSIREMEEAAEQLEKELRDLGPGSKEFQKTAEELGQVRKGLKQAADQADEFAVKAGGAARSSANFGNSMLQVSRLVDDAQYGAQGMINNFEGIAMALGLGSGVAGAATVAAVALNHLFKHFSKAKEGTEAAKGVKQLSDALDDIAEKNQKLADTRSELSTIQLSKHFEEERDAIDKATQAIIANIEATKRKIEADASLDKINTSSLLASLDQKERSGEISPEKAAEQRKQIEQGAAARELQRSKELSLMNEEVAAAQLDAANRSLKSAEAQKTLADQSMKGAELAMEEINRRVGAFKALLAASKDILGDPAEWANYTPEKMALAREGFPNLRQQGSGDIADELEKIFGMIEAYRSNPAPSAKDVGTVQSQVEKLTEDARAAAEALETLRKAAEAAKVVSDEAARRGSQERGFLDDRARAEGVGKELERATDAAEKGSADAGAKIAEVFEKWVRELGASAEAQKPAALIEQVREMLKDGLQDGEAGKIAGMVQQITGLINRVTTDSANAFNGMIGVLETQAGVISKMQATIARLEEAAKNQSREKK